MPRICRNDSPGSWHHVMNRGIAHRTLFERTSDIRFFLARMARVVRLGRIKIHAFCLMATHFHMMVESPRGELSAAMERIQDDYSHRFNRIRGRDGPLVRGRFQSKVIGSLLYRRMLVRYIDRNAFSAGLATRTGNYPFCSIQWYSKPKGPSWLERTWVEGEICGSFGLNEYDPSAYLQYFTPDMGEEEIRFVEQRMRSNSPIDPFDDLYNAAPKKIKNWLIRQTRLGDGTDPGLPVCTPNNVEKVIRSRAEKGPEWRVRAKRRDIDGWLPLRSGLLRDLTGATWAEIGKRLGRSISNAHALYGHHNKLLAEDHSYANRAASITLDALNTMLR